ncbi:MAG TPA: DNA-3-methyladenine glycosylase [Candidatus Nitrosotenuis sp.]|nr:DNA-3-methyladenine glycosylase [Candidatus Nitrosotenuis sp.]
MKNHKISREFYARNTVDVAKDLLGKILVRKTGQRLTSGIITETEAYRHEDDPASHAYRSMTKRNEAMFGQVGCAYVYFTYGMYHCVNVVARSKQYKAGAVLIRALQPAEGIEIMMKNRDTRDISNLTNGPGKLTMALDITKNQYGEDLVNSSELFITSGLECNQRIITGPRIGIKKGVDKLWNFRIEI